MVNDIRHINHAAEYILNMRPAFDSRALFSDETGNFVSPMEPEQGELTTFRLRTARCNVDSACLISGSLRYGMKLECSEGSFDYYSVQITMPEKVFEYYFEIRSGRIRCYLHREGVSWNKDKISCFRVCPGFHTPDWAKGAVMYQIMTDRFCNGDPSNDVLDQEYSYIDGMSVQVKDWSRRPEGIGVREFYGGDLQGVLSKLDYLQELGIEVIYFNPLFVSPSVHKYDIQDYDHIDPHLGKIVRDEGKLLENDCTDNTQASRYISRVTGLDNLEASNELFACLVRECHSRGMRVIIDGVFNHCGSFNKWMDRERIYENQPGYEKGAYVSQDSPYRSFFEFTDESAWPYNPHYDGWWGHNTLPKLNYEGSRKLEDYILKIGAKWVSPPFCADGWRLDVAADLGHTPEYNHSFWKKFRRAVKEANPDALILAEHYGDAREWLQGDEWDSVMNYDAFMEPLTWFFTGMEKHSDCYLEGLYGNADSFMASMQFHMLSFMAPSLQTAMNELSNHDHSRFLTRTSHKVGRMHMFDYDAACEGVNPAVMREAVIMQMTWPGAPTVYYGDEAGVCGFTDPDNRRTYPWGHEDLVMLEFHRAAIRMHREYKVLKTGSLVFLMGDYNVLAYARFDREERAVVVFNNTGEEKQLEIPVYCAGIEDHTDLMRVLLSSSEGYTQDREYYPVIGGKFRITMKAFSGAVMLQDGN